jgi:predicted CopG family antitoxin
LMGAWREASNPRMSVNDQEDHFRHLASISRSRYALTGVLSHHPLPGDSALSKRYVVISVRVNINTDMGVKTITVTEEAYKMLAKEKKEDESFSEVIKRLTKERGKLSDSLGAWKMTDQEAEQIFSSLRRSWKKSTVRIRSNTRHS